MADGFGWWARAAALALVAAAYPAWAEDGRADDAVILSDPSYLPRKGQVAGTTRYQYSSYQATGLNASGQKVVDLSNRRHDVTQSLRYGFTDRVMLFTEMDYGDLHWRDNYANGYLAESTYKGFENPLLGMTVRALLQQRSQVNLDFTLSYAPDLFASRSAGAGQSGTVAQGGHVVQMDAAFSRHMDAMILQGFAGVAYSTATREEIVANGSVTTTAAAVDYRVGARSRVRLAEPLTTNLGLAYVIEEDRRISNDGGASYTLTPGNYADLSWGLDYHLIKGRVVAGFEYDHRFLQDAVVSNASSSSLNGNVTANRGRDFFGVRLQYLLN